MPYKGTYGDKDGCGPYYARRKDKDGDGLIFVCFNASIARQFELIQRHWLMDGDAFGLGNEQDLMLGRRESDSRMIIDGDRDRSAIVLNLPSKQFVTTRGGYYLFVPGIAGLKLISRTER
jgi:hypothetical protein